MSSFPQEFAEIARLSDRTRADVGRAVTATGNPGLSKQVQAQVQKEYRGGTTRQALFEHLGALSDDSFKELMGWMLFGRDYTPVDGDPYIVLERYISDAVIYPRAAQESYLEQKPIGEYLRNAEEHLESTTREDIESAQLEEYGCVQEDEDEGCI